MAGVTINARAILVSIQAAKGLQCKGNLGFFIERGMTAGKDETQALIRDVPIVKAGLFGGAVAGGEQRLDFFREMGLAAQPVNGFVPCGLNDPGARGIRYAGNRPLIESCRKRFLCVLFRQIEIPEKADQGCEDSTPIGAIQCFHGRIGVCRHSLILKFFSA